MKVDLSNEVVEQLIIGCARSYSGASIRWMVARAGVREGFINFNQGPQGAWMDVFRAAEDQRRLTQLIDAIQSQASSRSIDHLIDAFRTEVLAADG